jgi:hypothetical protein
MAQCMSATSNNQQSVVHNIATMPFELEHRPPLQTRKRAAPHPSAGGRGDGHSQDMRDLIMAVNNVGVSNHPIFAQLRAMHVFLSKSTERRHVNLQNTLGHTRASSVIKISSSWHSIGLHSLKLQPPRLMPFYSVPITAT